MDESDAAKAVEMFAKIKRRVADLDDVASAPEFMVATMRENGRGAFGMAAPGSVEYDKVAEMLREVFEEEIAEAVRWLRAHGFIPTREALDIALKGETIS